MPVSGYYEWHYQNPADKTEKPQPYYFTRRDGKVMTVAALHATWPDRVEGRDIRSCTMVITEPNALVGAVMDRMPVVLEPSQFEQWLHGTADEAAALMQPAAEDVLQRWPVSKRINSSHTAGDDPSLIERVEPGTPSPQGRAEVAPAARPRRRSPRGAGSDEPRLL
jgi:putative SOS response-associated peptidase YedK